MTILKKILILSFVILSTSLLGEEASDQNPLEIQCNSPISGLDIVIKRSPDTGRAYALLLSETKLETYNLLILENISEESDLFFKYKQDEQIIDISLEDGLGHFAMGWSDFFEEPIELHNCHSTTTH